MLSPEAFGCSENSEAQESAFSLRCEKSPENMPEGPAQSAHTQSRHLQMKWGGEFSVERQHFKETSRFTERPQKSVSGRRPHGLRSAEQAACLLRDVSFHNEACFRTLSEKCKEKLRLPSVSLPTADKLLLVRDLQQVLRAKKSTLCCLMPEPNAIKNTE